MLEEDISDDVYIKYEVIDKSPNCQLSQYRSTRQ